MNRDVVFVENPSEFLWCSCYGWYGNAVALGFCFISLWFALVLLCGFKKGSTDTTRPFQRFPDVVFLLPLPLFHQKYHVCTMVRGLYNTHLVLQILMAVKYTGLCVSVYALMLKLYSRNLMIWSTVLMWAIKPSTFFVLSLNHVSSTL